MYALTDSKGSIHQAAKILRRHPATVDRWIGQLGLRNLARQLRYSVNSGFLAGGVLALVFTASLFLFSQIALAQGPVYPYSVLLTWSAPTVGAAPTGYNVYRAAYASGACGTYAVLNASAVSTTTYTDTTVVAGSEYCYEVTALNGTAESGPDVLASNPVILPPAPPTGVSATVK